MRGLTILIIGVVLAGLAVVGSMTLLSNDGSGESTDNSAIQQAESLDEAVQKNNVVIKYTDNGFEPSTVAVPVGVTVVFSNESGQSMWVASDVHPTHEELPGFDAKKGISSGQSYEFTFSQKGTWSYHNHLATADTGTVTVE